VLHFQLDDINDGNALNTAFPMDIKHARSDDLRGGRIGLFHVRFEMLVNDDIGNTIQLLDLIVDELFVAVGWRLARASRDEEQENKSRGGFHHGAFSLMAEKWPRRTISSNDAGCESYYNLTGTRLGRRFSRNHCRKETRQSLDGSAFPGGARHAVISAPPSDHGKIAAANCTQIFSDNSSRQQEGSS
jgi:hypothetical protein